MLNTKPAGTAWQEPQQEGGGGVLHIPKIWVCDGGVKDRGKKRPNLYKRDPIWANRMKSGKCILKFEKQISIIFSTALSALQIRCKC